MNKEEKLYIKGMNDMLEWVKSLPIEGSAGRMLGLHLSPIEDWMEKVKNVDKKEIANLLK